MRKLSGGAFFALATLIWTSTIVLPWQGLAQTQTANPAASTKRAAKSVVYVDKRYGFRFYLPESWKGYSILADKWEGHLIAKAGDSAPSQPESGPRISIRHPLWSSGDPRQDIPIMIFTLAQWKLIENEKLSVSAAPIGPSELGRNAKYVFALPPRYDYAFPTGYEEVEKIVGNKSLQAF